MTNLFSKPINTLSYAEMVKLDKWKFAIKVSIAVAIIFLTIGLWLGYHLRSLQVATVEASQMERFHTRSKMVDMSKSPFFEKQRGGKK